MTTETKKPLALRILPDILAFGIGLGVAYFLKWETTDLVWSLWLCSLVLGYLTILSVIGGGAYFGLHLIRHKDFHKEKRGIFIIIGILAGVFFLGFFSLHFGGFHAVHSVFLQGFFPLEGLPKDGFGAAFMNPPLLWVFVFRHLLRPYGIFLIPAIIAERKHVFQSLITAVKTVKAAVSSPDPALGKPEEKKAKVNFPLGDAMGRPYLNVVRMHLLIFFFAFCHALKVDNFLVYVVVYSVYFFPWSEIRNLTRKTSSRA